MTGGEASCGIRMEHTRLGKPLSGECKSASPRGLALLTTTPECLPPKAKRPVPKDPEAIKISRHCVVVEVALHHRPEPFASLILASVGEITEPCGVPVCISDHWPSSITPALSHFRISRRILGSATRCSTNLISQLLSRLSKKPCMSASRT